MKKCSTICPLILTISLCFVEIIQANDSEGSNTNTISLAGSWQFTLDPDNKGEKQKFYNTVLQETVQLPGTTDENKKGKKKVVSTARHLNRLYEYTGIAWYQKKVTIPKSWESKRIILFIEMAHWSTRVWVNDQAVPGVQESLSVPHRHDLTDFLSPGEHTITVSVDNSIRFHLGGHSYSDQTQTNWNGMVGRLELQATDMVWLADVQVYPNAEQRMIEVDVTVGNKWDADQKIAVELKVGATQSIESATAKAQKNSQFTWSMKLSPESKLWDDVSPNLHTLEVKLTSSKQTSYFHSVRFGLRDVTVINKRVALNGVPLFLRGNLETCVFPLTGYPSPHIEDWKRIFLAYQEHGLNHVRFHSYTPPKAAFEAADELGIILQTELPFWGLTGVDKEKDAYLRRELDRILDEYGNHASLVLFCMGNELNVRGGDFDVLEKWVKHAQQKNSRHLHTASTSLFKKFRPSNEYHVSTRIRQIYDAGTDWDYTKEIANFYPNGDHPPLISHESGQWCVYPDFREMDQYTGILRAKNFEIFKQSLENNHMGDQAKDFMMASGKLSALLYRQEMEAVYRSPLTAGFQLLGLDDFPGQGTATIGMLNVFREPKGFIEAEEWRRSSNIAVALLRFAKRTWKTSETFTGEAQFIHFHKTTLKDAVAKWSISTEEGKKIAAGSFAPKDVATGELVTLGKIEANLESIKEASRLSVRMTVNEETVNDWNIWAFPEIEEKIGDVLITREWNDAAKKALEKGGKVLLMPKLQAGQGTLPAQFLPPFWSPLFKADQSSTMGLLLDPQHPVFEDFPTDFHTDWQWYDILVTENLSRYQSAKWMWSGFDTYSLVLDKLPSDYRPLVQPIDHFYRNKRLGLLMEGLYGQGKLMICTADLEKDTDRRMAVPQFKQSILNYMNSDQFSPTLAFKDEMFDHWFDFSVDGQNMKIKFVSSQMSHEKFHAESIIDGNLYTYWMNSNDQG
ncbi:MAG: sugar-binding domain-containing protein, partial [Verrucomicrobiota bacterium]